ncbi:hypothetical protein ACFOEQ_08320 [Chryseobacterium arachidis]|uniref:hypothetical protein n=1 Tax=Chryseobacterium arachidis TaxID=1416778 RepID=UPI003616B3D0
MLRFSLFFATNNPVAAANGQCNMIAGSSYNANREWYSGACNGTALSGANVSSIIVEFNQYEKYLALSYYFVVFLHCTLR